MLHDAAVAQRVRATGVVADVAADRRAALARRIGAEQQAVRRQRVGERQVHHARLDERGPGLGVDLEDAPQPCGGDDDAARRDRAAGESGARSARDQRHLGARARGHDSGGLGGRAGCRDERRGGPIEPGVVFVHQQIRGVVEEMAAADDGGQLVRELTRARRSRSLRRRCAPSSRSGRSP